MARPGLTNHRKFRRLAKQLGSVAVARGVLELIWETCYESGDEYVGTAEDIDQVIAWTGEPGVVALALVSAGQPEGQGFLEPVSPNGAGPMRYRVHDLWHHAPDYVTKRRKREMERRERVEPVSAERRRTAPTSDRQAGDVLPPSPSHAPSPAPAPRTPSAKEVDQERFERWWAEYPKKVGKDAARREWLKRSPSADLLELMITKVREQRASAQWLKDDGQFIPHPRTWLHRGQWQDEEAEPPIRADIHGHVPPCRTWGECTQKVLAEAQRERNRA